MECKEWVRDGKGGGLPSEIEVGGGLPSVMAVGGASKIMCGQRSVRRKEGREERKTKRSGEAGFYSGESGATSPELTMCQHVKFQADDGQHRTVNKTLRMTSTVGINDRLLKAASVVVLQIET